MGRTSEEHTAIVEGCYLRRACHCFRKEKELELWEYPNLHAIQQPKRTTDTAPIATVPSQNKMTPSHSEGKGWADIN